MAERLPGETKAGRSVKKALLRYFGPRDGVVDVSVDGLRFRCHTHDNATERNIALSGDRRNRTKLNAIMQRLPERGTFIDIGANCGLYTLMAARKAGPLGQVIAIEAAPVMIGRLKYNVAANGFGTVRILETAVGDATGTATLHSDPTQHGKSSIAGGSGSLEVDVPLATLLAVTAQIGIAHIDALKIDVEGYEDRVLLPFLATAPPSLWPRAILMETKWAKRWQSDCGAICLAKGYRIIWQDRADMMIGLDEQRPF